MMKRINAGAQELNLHFENGSKRLQSFGLIHPEPCKANADAEFGISLHSEIDF